MHPNAAFRWDDPTAMRDMVTAIGFGTLFAATPDGPRVAHVPVAWMDDGRLGFHLSRGNALTRHLDGLTALFTLIAADGYVSPDWYGEGPEQVPTWNYVSVELEGPARRLSRDGLVQQIDRMTATNEARLAPKPAWTRDKMPDGRFDAMLAGITGFSIEPLAWRGTRKLAQTKPDAARLAAADALDAGGRRAIAHWMRDGVA